MIIKEADVRLAERLLNKYERYFREVDALQELGRLESTFFGLDISLDGLSRRLVRRLETFARLSRRRWTSPAPSAKLIARYEQYRRDVGEEVRREWPGAARRRWERPGLSTPDRFWTFLGQNPQLFMVLGFDEYRVFQTREDDWDVDDGVSSVLLETYGLARDAIFPYEPVVRDASSGAWFLFDGLQEDERGNLVRALSFSGARGRDEIVHDADAWLETLRQRSVVPDEISRTIWLPSAWTPHLQKTQSLVLQDSVQPLLRALFEQKQSLREVKPRELEELVAELLREHGLQVQVTPSTRDGGRDIVARGELFPGEPSELAIEVKQKPTVGIADVQRALRANEDYPSLMIATAGSFSGGVVQERSLDRNRLRLFLKDGIALSQWINAYGERKRWPNESFLNTSRRP